MEQRGRPLVFVDCLVAAIIVGSLGGSPAWRTEGERWNVVIITADTLRGDMLAVNGNRRVQTPHLTALAREGVNFRRAYTNITTTVPAHGSLFSSLYPVDHGAYDNGSRLGAAITTLDEVLRDAGWYTAAAINMPWLKPEASAVVQGLRRRRRGQLFARAEQTNLWVREFLERWGERQQPFFLWIHYIDNHAPYYAPASFTEYYYPPDRDPRRGRTGSLQKVWPLFPPANRTSPLLRRWLRGITDVRWVGASYLGSVSWVDLHVGEVVEILKQNGLWENTLFVFTADHGESLGEHGLWFCHGGLYETTVHIPLIIRVPGGPRAVEVESVVELVDVMPTILTRLGLPSPAAVRGADLWPLIGRTGEPPRGVALLEHAGGLLTGVVTPRYKLIKHLRTAHLYPAYPLRWGTVELYDLQADPQERRNLARERPHTVRRLLRLLYRLRADRRPVSPPEKAVDDATLEQLHSFGSIQ